MFITVSYCICQEIKADKNIHISNYNGARRTRFIIPGYLEKGEEDWPQEMCKVRKAHIGKTPSKMFFENITRW